MTVFLKVFILCDWLIAEETDWLNAEETDWLNAEETDWLNAEETDWLNAEELRVDTSVADPDPYVLGAPDPDPFVRDPDPNPCIIKQK